MLSLVMGLHWTLIQSVAFVGMAVRYSQNDPLPTALSKTFNGQNPCSICILVKDGRAAESKNDTQTDQVKNDFLWAVIPGLVFAPAEFHWVTPNFGSIALQRDSAPPFHPPRTA